MLAFSTRLNLSFYTVVSHKWDFCPRTVDTLVLGTLIQGYRKKYKKWVFRVQSREWSPSFWKMIVATTLKSSLCSFQPKIRFFHAALGIGSLSKIFSIIERSIGETCQDLAYKFRHTLSVSFPWSESQIYRAKNWTILIHWQH